jgi:CheY-like chemotaxis protein
MQPGSTKQRLLLVDGDPKSLRVLDVSLKKAGFQVTTATSGSEALAALEAEAPDLIISETHMPELSGFELCQQVRARAEWHKTPFIFLSARKSVDEKIQGLQLGADDYLSKPVYIKEITARVRMLLQRREREKLESRRGDSRTRFAGSLADMGMVDLVQTIEVNRKSGIIHVHGHVQGAHPGHAGPGAKERRRGGIYFRDGRVVDAETGRLSGAEALYRMFFWAEGDFEVEFKPIRRRDVIELAPPALLMEGMRRVDEWGRLQEVLPALDSVFVVDYHLLAERLADIPDEVNAVLRLFDGRRVLGQVVEDSDIPEIAVGNIIAKLAGERLIYEVQRDGSRGGSEAAAGATPLERWLGHSVPGLPRRRDGGERRGADAGDREEGPAEGESDRDELPDGRGGPHGAAPDVFASDEPSAPVERPGPRVVPTHVVVATGSAGAGVGKSQTLRGVGPEAEAVAAAVAEVQAAAPARGTRLMSVPQVLDEGGPSDTVTGVPSVAARGSSEQAVIPLRSPEAAEVNGTGKHSAAAARADADDEEGQEEEDGEAEEGQAPTHGGGTAAAGNEQEEEEEEEEETALPAPVAAARSRSLPAAPPPERTPAPSSTGTFRAEDTFVGHEGEWSGRRRLWPIWLGVVGATVVGALVVAKFVGKSTVAEVPPASAPVASEVPPPAVPAAGEPAATQGAAPGAPGAPGAALPAVALPGGSAAAEPAAAPAADPAPAAPVDGEFARLREECVAAATSEQYKAIVTACNKALDRKADAADVMVVLAQAELDKGKVPKALTLAKKAVEVDANLPEAYVVIGTAEQAAGRRDEAKAAYQKYLDLAPTGKYADDLKAILATL